MIPLPPAANTAQTLVAADTILRRLLSLERDAIVILQMVAPAQPTQDQNYAHYLGRELSTGIHGDDVENLAPKNEVGIVAQKGTAHAETVEARVWTKVERNTWVLQLPMSLLTVHIETEQAHHASLSLGDISLSSNPRTSLLGSEA